MKFSEKHPIAYGLLCLILLMVLATPILIGVFFLLKFIGMEIRNDLHYLTSIASKLDAVVIVALITGAVSITGVVISSIVAKSIEYKKSRQAYLAQKREKSYGEFVEMVYKIQQNSKKPNSYTEDDMLKDMLSFSQELTLWGSKKVANKWVEFRLNGAKPDAGQENLFVLESIMNEMRKDMGTKKVKKGNLLSFFINDIKDKMRK